jgi:hypothetical protein
MFGGRMEKVLKLFNWILDGNSSIFGWELSASGLKGIEGGLLEVAATCRNLQKKSSKY